VRGPLTEGLRIDVDRPGLYAVSYQEARNAGFLDGPVPFASVRLSRNGQPVAGLVEDDGDGSWEPGENVLLVWGGDDRSVDDTDYYTKPLPFWLTRSSPTEPITARNLSDLPAPLVPGVPATLVFDEDRTYRSNIPPRPDADHWFWASITARSDRTGVVSLTLPLPALVAGPVTTTLRISGYALDEGTHRLDLTLNGYPQGVLLWTGQGTFSATAEVYHFLLREGENTLTLSLAEPSNTAFLDRILVQSVHLRVVRALSSRDGALVWQTPLLGRWTYPLRGFPDAGVMLFDVTVPTRPVRLESAALTAATTDPRRVVLDTRPGDRFLAVAAGNVYSPTLALVHGTQEAYPPEGADYLVIGPRAFEQAIGPLLTRRAAQGLRVHYMPTEAIAVTFGGGRLTGQAVRDFLADAYTKWPRPAPTYILLLGDGHYDLANVLGGDAPNIIPPVMHYLDPWLGEIADEAAFATLDGDDSLPDVLVGRIPVDNVDEARAVVNKITAWEEQVSRAPWRWRQVVVADNRDGAGDFPDLARQAVARIPAPYRVQTITLGAPGCRSPRRVATGLGTGRSVHALRGARAVERLGRRGLVAPGGCEHHVPHSGTAHTFHPGQPDRHFCRAAGRGHQRGAASPRQWRRGGLRGVHGIWHLGGECITTRRHAERSPGGAPDAGIRSPEWPDDLGLPGLLLHRLPGARLCPVRGPSPAPPSAATTASLSLGARSHHVSRAFSRSS